MSKTYTVGQVVYVGRNSNHEDSFSLAKVMKVTASGQVVTKWCGASGTVSDDCEPIRFKPDGYEQGRERYSIMTHYLDDALTVEARTALLANNALLKSVAMKLHSIEVTRGINCRWGKEGLATEIARLQTLLDAAKTLLEAAK